MTAKRALVLGGGGGFGLVQAAYMQAAYELGFRADLVIGTSVGSMNGAWLAMHPEESHGLLGIWRELGKQKVLHLNPLRLAGRVVRRNRGFCPNEIVPYMIKNHIGEVRFEETEVPLYVVATNLTAGRKHVFQSGKLAPAITASTAIPGVFEPYERHGELFMDGSVTASLDLQTAVELGATEILAIDLTPEFGNAVPRTPIGVLRRSFGVLSHATTDAMHAAASAHAITRVLRPDLRRHSPWRICVREEIIGASVLEARAVLREVIAEDGSVRAAAPESVSAGSGASLSTSGGRRPFKTRGAYGESRSV
ncbi:MAG: patatin-like phospholipase family protein [Tepidiformaceae bacterium]